ncbi:DDE-type integrase/transposase/recombinase [Pseudolabrys sp. FHR47]|uniref:DDE-type integrase/transposase/recombinase n=1 Tax=Pseudolabrys sp. FHR47 TaxID=2562284 RepID=UPI0010BE7DA2|nr:DDE-type integrase/transposase/recombinase [Pseudolabrys sp. FHR47]
MNKLDPKTRAQILTLLCEGMAIRAITRVTGASKNTVAKLLADVGQACAAYHDQHVRGLTSQRIQMDEIWSFVYAKNDNVKRAKSAPADAGDVWTWTAIDADSKLLVSWLVGDRTTYSALRFVDDLKSRLANRVQLTSDGHRPYLQAVDTVFGADVDYAMLNKIYGAAPSGERRYSPAVCIGAQKKRVTGNPDVRHVSTSYAERQNLTMRMHMRRFTRLTNAFSKKIENHTAAVALHTMYYNFVRIHQTLKISPAMAAGVTDRLWDVSDIVAVLEAWEAERVTEPTFDVEANKIGEGHFVRVTFRSGETEAVYGFADKAAAIKWIRCEAVVWLWQQRQESFKKFGV